VVAGVSGPELVRRKPPYTVDLVFTLTAASERTAELFNLMAAVATFLNRNRWLELPRDPNDAARGVARWELDADGEFRTQLGGRTTSAPSPAASSCAASTSTRGCPLDLGKRVTEPELHPAQPSQEVPRDRLAHQHERALPRLRAAHETYCKALGECACDVEQGRARRRTPSLTLATGVTSPALDDAVLAVPDVVRAVRRGELAVKRHVAEPKRPAPRTTPTPTSAPRGQPSP
jgi:hypothetical protein